MHRAEFLQDGTCIALFGPMVMVLLCAVRTWEEARREKIKSA
jgi:hypothetical protein